jgi:hypothetical protein
MKEHGWIEPIVERVVGQVLDSHVAQLRNEIVRRVMAEIDVEAATEPGRAHPVSAPSAPSSSSDLARAVSEIQLGTSQREVLRAMLDASARYAARVALFVVKGSHATGWQGRGFAKSDAIKDFALDENAPAIARVIGKALGRATADRIAASLPAADPADDMDARFFQQVGTPASGEIRIFPLILKDKVAALVYADSGTGSAGLLDAGSLELLVLSTSAWLEVNSLRKQAQKEPSALHADSASIQSADAPTYSAHSATATAFPAFNDPFASQAPAFAPPRAMAAAAAGGTSAAFASDAFEAPATEAPSVDAQTEVQNNVQNDVQTDSQYDVQADTLYNVQTDVQTKAQTEIQAEAQTTFAPGVTESESVISPWPSEVQTAIAEMEPALAEPLPLGHAETAAAPQPMPAAALSPEDQDIHRKAQRFARLLVDEIKLYNQAKVADGRQNRDLYDRLKEVIDKSRVTYQKRYGNTVAASANYLEHEIMRSLAEDDPSIMGANFRQ